ncbi:hypothetical protein RFI_37659, partial [Reticulomyxa filosa]
MGEKRDEDMENEREEKENRFPDKSQRKKQKPKKKKSEHGMLNLETILASPQLLNIFAEFLVREYCLEGLLFLLCVIQFKRHLCFVHADIIDGMQGEFVD